MVKSRAATIDKYLAAQPAPVRGVLAQVRSTVHQAVPEAVETMSYGMPAFKLRGRVLLYFAGWKEHWALYPGAGAVVALLGDALAPYQVSKGTIRFPLSRPVPRALIGRIARLRARMVAERQPVRAAAPRRRPAGPGRPAPRTAGRGPVDRLRRLCLALPEAVEKPSHGEPTWFAGTGKVFAMLDDHHHGAAHLSVWIPLPFGAQEALVGKHPERYFRPPYVGGKGWVAVVLDGGPDWKEVARLVQEAYLHAAPRRLAARLLAGG